MQDNQGKEIRLNVGGFDCTFWDEVVIDSQIDVPADAFSFTLFNPPLNALPEAIKAGAVAEIYYANELILTGIVDSISESVGRLGYLLQVSGRDLAGQLIDCSVPMKNTRQVMLSTLLEEYVLADELGKIFNTFRIQDDNWLKNKITIEPGESLYDAIVKAAQVTGQFVWMDEQGVLNIGDPFKFASQNQHELILMRSRKNNNVLSAEYKEDVSGIYGAIKILSQDAKGEHILAETQATTPYSYRRSKIVILSDVETQAEAQAAINKIQHDNDLEAYSLNCTVPDWLIDSKVWKTGWLINLNSDVLRRANAQWVVLGRTLKLSRKEGKTTELKLKRKGDWVQPLIYKESK